MSTRSTIPTSDEPLLVDLRLLSRLSLGPHPLRVPLEEAKIAAILASTDAEVSEPGLVDFEILVHSGESVLVRGSIHVSLQVPCARCLEPARVASRAEICVNFVKREIPAAGGDDEESEVDLEAPEEMTYSGTLLDLRPLVDENIGLAYPMRALCTLGEACRGLCHACGRNLNVAEGAGCPRCRDATPANEADRREESSNDPSDEPSADPNDDPRATADPGAGAGGASGEEPAWKAALRTIKVPRGDRGGRS